ncbi:MAG: PPC domain-containing protein [Thermoguttaceae bacterium]|nr:PPC domain-containing protein [Thermoguttaceae bacterium]MBR0190607.1 PPC domain-containing protein [Thermoguttaceae bacterium]
MRTFLSAFCCVFFFVSTLFAQNGTIISYSYPAGGQRGTTFRVLIGGRGVVTAEEVQISGEGVTAKILKRFKSLQQNNVETTNPTRQVWRAGHDVVTAEESFREGIRLENDWIREMVDSNPMKTPDEKAIHTVAEICEEFPFIEDVVLNPTPENVQTLYYEYILERPEKKPKETMNQGIELEVTIAPDAPCGDRWLLLRGQNGEKSAPILFQVGDLPEVNELEPNDSPELPTRWDSTQKKMVSWAYLQSPPAQTPVLFNGRIRPGDVDRFRFEAKKGQKLVISALGRFLNPYLADAVPGWFQPILKVYGPNGREAANAFSWKNDPDPAMIFDVPEGGVFTLEIQDSLFRGRDDFVYRVAVGEIPMITSVYPPCAQEGKPFSAEVFGVNLPQGNGGKAKIEMASVQGSPNWNGVPVATLREVGGKPLIRPISFTVEKEAPREAVQGVQDAEIPSVFYGRLAQKGKPAEFRFQGKKGQRVAIDVTATSLDSTLDSRLELIGPDGKIIAECDDRAGCDGPNIGWETHHADPVLSVEIPEDGTYTARLSNTLYEENPEAIYRVRFAEPEPDFLVFSAQPNIWMNASVVKLNLELVRLGGWDGPVEIVSTDPGLTVQGGVFLPGVAKLACTLTFSEELWPKELNGKEWNKAVLDQPLPLKARAYRNAQAEQENGAPNDCVEHEILAAFRLEQAFIYFHLIPVGEVMANYRGPYRAPSEVVSETPLKIPRDGSEFEVQFCPAKMKNVNPNSRKDWGPPNRWYVLAPECEGFEVVHQQELRYRQILTVRVTDPEKAAKCPALIFGSYWFKEDPDFKYDGKTVPPDVNVYKPIGNWLPAVPVE